MPSITTLFKRLCAITPALALTVTFASITTFSYGETQFKYEAAKMNVNGFLIEGYTTQSKLQSGVHKTAINEIIKEDMEKNKTGYNIDLLRELTDTITNYYRSQGYFLASSYIPQQTADDGYIVIKITEGTLAGVKPNGNKVFSTELLQDAFLPYIGNPVSKDEIESAVLLVNDYLGYTGTAIFSPGSKIGETVLILNTEEETKTKTVIGIDNSGIETTGKYRIRGDVYINNLSNSADQLSMHVNYALLPSNNISLSSNYSRPIINQNINLLASYNFNNYEIGGDFADLGIHGSSHIISTTMNFKHLRTTPKNINYNFGLAYKYSESGDLSLQDTYSNALVLTAGGNMSGNTKLLDGKYFIQASLSSGLLDELTNTLDNFFDEQFIKLNSSNSFSFPVPSLTNQYVLIKSQLQFTEHTLHSSERLTLGGAQAVRGLPIDEYTVDSGLIVNIEWIAKSKPSTDFGWLKNIQITGFIDNAYGAINAPESSNASLTEEGNSTFQSTLGVGINLSPSKKFQFKSSVGYRPTQIDSSVGAGITLLANASYQF